TPEILQLARWVADYYAAPLGEVIKATLPPGINPPPQGSVVKAKVRRFIRITEAEPRKLTDKQQRVLTVLQQHRSMPLQQLIKDAGVSGATVNALEKKGLVEIFEEAVRRDPLAHTTSSPAEEYTLTAAQQSVFEKIQEQVNEETYGAFLLHGVTGSG